jgi:hypothetical protein
VFYGQLHNDGHVMLSKVTDPQRRYGMPPGVMEHFETATRDPAFFRLHKHVDNLFKLHKDLLPPYDVSEVTELSEGSCVPDKGQMLAHISELLSMLVV